MTLFSVVGGFAARGSQVFEKVEEDMSNLIEKRMENYISRGQARWESHKAEKKLKRTLAKTLKSYGLSVDQIGVALEQGRGEEVLSHLKQFESASPALKAAYGYDINNVVNMGPDYEESGMTMDEMLTSVTGKVSGGMNLTDALSDGVGPSKQNVFAKFLSPDTNKIAKRKMQAYETVYGKGTLSQMGQYATGSLQTTDLPFTGKISIRDVLQEKKMLDAISTDELPKNYNAVKKDLSKYGKLALGFTEKGDGLLMITPEARKKIGQNAEFRYETWLNNQLAELKVPSGGTITEPQMQQIRGKVEGWVNTLRTDQKKEREEKDTKGNATELLTTLQNEASATAMTAKRQQTWIQEYAQALVDSGQQSNLDTAKIFTLNKFKEFRDVYKISLGNTGATKKKRSQGGYKGD
jgi:hypothetical protein